MKNEELRMKNCRLRRLRIIELRVEKNFKFINWLSLRPPNFVSSFFILHFSFFILHSKSAHPLANYRLPNSAHPLFATMESVFFEGNDTDKATKGGKTGKRARKARLGENERNWPIFVKNILPALGIPFVTLPTSKDYRNRHCREAVFL